MWGEGEPDSHSLSLLPPSPTRGEGENCAPHLAAPQQSVRTPLQMVIQTSISINLTSIDFSFAEALS